MIKVNDVAKCCGCSSCLNICPQRCIEMVEDSEGFLYPKVDVSMCVECNMCEKVCPILNSSKEDTPHKQSAYLLQHRNEKIRHESTSGGAFTAISSWVIKQGGVVFGAAYRKGTFIVEHQAVEKEEELLIFRNSKYVQSCIGDSYRRVKEYLNENRWVCFSGTPCQIEGLKSFLQDKDYERLICVDLVCRGVPSPLIFRKYIEFQHDIIGGEIKNILFRDKYHGYHYSSFSIYTDCPQNDYHKGVDSNPYLRAFFANLSDRPSCYDCRFKKRYRKSDITIWDCFEVEKFTNKFDKKGTTRVLVQSSKGEMIINEIKETVKLFEVEPDLLVKNVREMFYSVPRNEQRTQFFNDSISLSAKELFNKWFPVTWKVRINSFVRITCHCLGIYSVAKRFFLMFYTRRDERNK